MLRTRHNLQYTADGVWVGDTHPLVMLPPTITQLYSDWTSSRSKTFTFFRHYLTEISNVCVSNLIEDSVNHFLDKSSLNTCRERLRNMTVDRTREILDWELRRDRDSHAQLVDLLDNKLSYTLLDMSRLKASMFHTGHKCPLDMLKCLENVHLCRLSYIMVVNAH